MDQVGTNWIGRLTYTGQPVRRWAHEFPAEARDSFDPDFQCESRVRFMILLAYWGLGWRFQKIYQSDNSGRKLLSNLLIILNMAVTVYVYVYRCPFTQVPIAQIIQMLNHGELNLFVETWRRLPLIQVASSVLTVPGRSPLSLDREDRWFDGRCEGGHLRQKIETLFIPTDNAILSTLPRRFSPFPS